MPRPEKPKVSLPQKVSNKIPNSSPSFELAQALDQIHHEIYKTGSSVTKDSSSVSYSFTIDGVSFIKAKHIEMSVSAADSGGFSRFASVLKECEVRVTAEFSTDLVEELKDALLTEKKHDCIVHVYNGTTIRSTINLAGTRITNISVSPTLFEEEEIHITLQPDTWIIL